MRTCRKHGKQREQKSVKGCVQNRKLKTEGQSHQRTVKEPMQAFTKPLKPSIAKEEPMRDSRVSNAIKQERDH